MLGEMLSLGGNLLNNWFAGERQSDAQEFSAQQFASRYQTTTKDMKAAGLNPMLAYSQGGGNAPTSSAASSAGVPDMGQTMMQAKMNAAQVANVQADTENKRVQSALIQAQTEHATASAGQANAQTGLINETVNKVVAETKNLGSEFHRINAAADQLTKQAQLLYKQGLNATEIGNNLRATLTQINAQTGLFNSQTAINDFEKQLRAFDVDAAKSAGNLGREYGQFGGTLKILLDVLKTLKR